MNTTDVTIERTAPDDKGQINRQIKESSSAKKEGREKEGLC